MGGSFNGRLSNEGTRRRWWVVYLSLTVIVGTAQATTPLDSLPSADGLHLAAVAAMADNQWLNLGAPAPDPRWGAARGRSWSARMPYADDLGGAFLFGEGRHGGMHDDVHYGDDLYFYDSRGHRWICAYPGTDVTAYDMILNDDGFEALPDGSPVPVASMVHGYAMVSYDSDRGLFMSMPAPGSYWPKQLPERVDFMERYEPLLNGYHRNLPRHEASPWFYDPASGSWDRLATPSPSPRSHFAHNLMYLPSTQEAFFLGHKNAIWAYRTATNRWRQLNPSGDPPIAGWDANAVYDPQRDRVYLGGGLNKTITHGNTLWIYDVQANRGIRPQPQGEAPTRYYTNNAVMTYDTANDAVLVFVHSADAVQPRGIHAYHPEDNRWETLETAFPAIWREHWSRSAVNGFYDPVLNAHLFHVAGNSRRNGIIIAYRYRQ